MLSDRTRRCFAGALALAALMALTACGGGGGGTTGGGGGGGGGDAGGGGGGGGGAAAAMTGYVTIPSAQAAAAGLSKGRADEVPVSGADVALFDVGGATVLAGPVKTDSSGKYSFTTIPASKTLEVRASKQNGGKVFWFKALFKSDANGKPIDEETPNAPSIDISAVTTVGFEAALNRFESLATDDTFNATLAKLDIYEFSKELAKELAKHLTNGSNSFQLPDLSDLVAIDSAGTSLVAQEAPVGAFVGTFTGDSKGKLGILVRNGNFTVVPIYDSQTTAQNVDDTSVGYGTVTEEGILSAISSDITIEGTILGGYGSGTWSSEQGGSGTWTATSPKQSYAGLYAGFFEDDSFETGGHFVALVTDDNAVYVQAFEGSWQFGLFGVGTYNNGTLDINVTDTDGSKGKALGTISGNVFSGKYTAADESEFLFSASLAFDPFDF